MSIMAEGWEVLTLRGLMAVDEHADEGDAPQAVQGDRPGAGGPLRGGIGGGRRHRDRGGRERGGGSALQARRREGMAP